MAGEARTAKARLRRALRNARRGFPPERQASAAEALARHTLDAAPLAGAATVAAYVASDGELDPSVLVDALRARGARILFPRSLKDGSLELAVARVLRPTGPGGVLEPDGAPEAPDCVPRPAVLLAPAVALDGHGHRLGRGGGGYDRLLPELRRHGWRIVGVCHAEHVLPRLPVESHDAPVDAILTEQGLVWTGRGG